MDAREGLIRLAAAVANNVRHPASEQHAVTEEGKPVYEHGLTEVFAADVVAAGNGITDEVAKRLVAGAKRAGGGMQRISQKTHELRRLLELATMKGT